MMWHELAALPIIAVMGVVAIFMSPRPRTKSPPGPQYTQTTTAPWHFAQDLRDMLWGLPILAGVLTAADLCALAQMERVAAAWRPLTPQEIKT